jgi:hypothetical protein
MTDDKEKKPGILARVGRFLTTPIVLVRDVPPEMAACEFSCRVTECAHGRWESCENRLRAMRETLEAATCELRCPAMECVHGAWDTCESRLSTLSKMREGPESA